MRQWRAGRKARAVLCAGPKRTASRDAWPRTGTRPTGPSRRGRVHTKRCSGLPELVMRRWPRQGSDPDRGSPSLMPMAAPPMAVKATEAESDSDEWREPKEARTEVMMMPPAVPVAMMPEASAVDLLNQRRGLYLGCQASDRCRHRRTCHQPQPKRANNSAEQCCLPHSCLLRLSPAEGRC
jgi:hypothetical protein